jgi:hypothetical protein
MPPSVGPAALAKIEVEHLRRVNEGTEEQAKE